MNIMSTVAVPAAPVVRASAIITAAHQLLTLLERGQRIEGAGLRATMETAFETSDASGVRDWKTAYEACECATVLFQRKYGRALFGEADTPIARLSALSKITGLLPTHTRRSEKSQALQRVPLCLLAHDDAGVAGARRPGTACHGRQALRGLHHRARPPISVEAEAPTGNH